MAALCLPGRQRAGGLDNCPAMYEAQVLIMEMTFVAPSHRKDKIHKFGHMHLDDVVERTSEFKNELIIASHFSTRYHGKRIRDLVRRRFPTCSTGACTCGCKDAPRHQCNHRRCRARRHRPTPSRVRARAVLPASLRILQLHAGCRARRPVRRLPAGHRARTANPRRAARSRHAVLRRRHADAPCRPSCCEP